MKIVGDYLHQKALKLTNNPEEMDLFARSAFNRYYYACFHLARNLVADIHPTSVGANHKQFHETILTTTIQSEIKKIAENQLKKKVIDRSHFSSIVSSSKRSLSQLEDILRRAYSVRCIADYHGEEVVCLEGGNLTLTGKTLHEASMWPKRAAIYCKEIKKQWDEIG